MGANGISSGAIDKRSQRRLCNCVFREDRGDSYSNGEKWIYILAWIFNIWDLKTFWAEIDSGHHLEWSWRCRDLGLKPQVPVPLWSGLQVQVQSLSSEMCPESQYSNPWGKLSLAPWQAQGPDGPLARAIHRQPLSFPCPHAILHLNGTAISFSKRNALLWHQAYYLPRVFLPISLSGL